MVFFKRDSKSRLFDPSSGEPFRISRSKIDLFFDCPRCFWLDRRAGVPRPSMPAFTLNNAVDTLLKKEFDIHRAKGSRHPLVQRYGIYSVPLEHEKLEEWRDSLRRGVQFHHAGTHFLVTGGIDDVWVDQEGKLNVVDYKATSKLETPNLDGRWQQGYKRQVEVYQWLFRQNGFAVSDTAYFVYCNGKTDRAAFDGKLEFDIQIIAYQGNDAWVEPTLHEIKQCLLGGLPPASPGCNYCSYVAEAGKLGE